MLRTRKRRTPDATNLTLFRLTELVQSRLRFRSIYLHNVVVREIIRLAADIISARIPIEQRAFLMDFHRGRYKRSQKAYNRAATVIRRRYGREWFEAPRTKILYKHAPRVRFGKREQAPRFTKKEMVRMIELQQELAEDGDHVAVSAVDKAIRSLRST